MVGDASIEEDAEKEKQKQKRDARGNECGGTHSPVAAGGKRKETRRR